jgi:hypothetical protein
MQAPRSMLVRMLEAAIADNVPELERLRTLDMASEKDYRIALQCAITQGSTAATMHLWSSQRRVPCEKSLHHLPYSAQLLLHTSAQDNLDEKNTDVLLARLALSSQTSAFLCEFAQEEPQLVLEEATRENVRRKLDRVHHSTSSAIDSERMHQNLYDLVICHQAMGIYPRTNDRKSLLYQTLHATLSAPLHPWQGVHARIVSLITVHGAVLQHKHLLLACSALSECQQAEEHATLLLLLGRMVLDTSEHAQVLEQCAKMASLKTGAPMHVLFDAFHMNDATGSYAHLASQHGSCAILEACLDRMPPQLLDAPLSNRLLLAMARNPTIRDWSRPLVHVLERLFVHATLEGVLDAFCVMDRLLTPQNYDMYLFLLEYLFIYGGPDIVRAMLQPIGSLMQTNFRWLLQRNTTTHGRRMSCMNVHQGAWECAFYEQQAVLRAVLVTDTPLALVLIDVVLQYA